MNTVLGYLSKYKLLITSLAILLIIGSVVVRISELSNPELDQDRLSEQQLTIKRVNFNEEAVQTILDLIDSNVDIGSEFTNRNNPFAE